MVPRRILPNSGHVICGELLQRVSDVAIGAYIPHYYVVNLSKEPSDVE